MVLGVGHMPSLHTTRHQWEQLLQLYWLYPFHAHPLWQAILTRELSLPQVLRAETQHYLRTKAGQALRREALDLAENHSPTIFKLLLSTYLEECTTTPASKNHLELIRTLLLTGGLTQEHLDHA